MMTKKEIEQLFEDVKHCKKCYNEEICVPKIDEKYSSFDNPDILTILERPGPGAHKSGLISADNNDPSADFGKNYIRPIIEKAGLSQFVTNACLCIPNSVTKNLKVTTKELRNCSEYLRKQIEILKPIVITTNGKKAIIAAGFAYPENSVLRKWRSKSMTELVKNHDQTTIKDIFIFPLFHGSALSRKTRKAEDQIKDMKYVVEQVKKLKENRIKECI